MHLPSCSPYSYTDTKPHTDSGMSEDFYKTQRVSALRVTFVSSSTKITHFEPDFVVPHAIQAKKGSSSHTAMQVLSTVDSLAALHCPRRPSGLVGNLHTCLTGAEVVSSILVTRICVLSSVAENVRA